MDSQLADGVSLLNLCSPASSEIALKKKRKKKNEHYCVLHVINSVHTSQTHNFPQRNITNEYL